MCELTGYMPHDQKTVLFRLVSNVFVKLLKLWNLSKVPWLEWKLIFILKMERSIEATFRKIPNVIYTYYHQKRT
jgi:hypothetical protein